MALRYPARRLLLNWLLGWWWADAVAALVMVPIIAREGVQGLRRRKLLLWRLV
jgi:divalent metal cation (Fe/Co/Zn/Cd) transporter